MTSRNEHLSGDPFADRPRQTHFQDPAPHAYDSASGSPFESTTTLPREFGANYVDEDYAEKLPLTGGDNYNPGGFYPPG
jgi:chitin synthase